MKKMIGTNNRFINEYNDAVVVFLDLMGIRNFTLTSDDRELCDVYAIIDRFISFTPGIPADPVIDGFSVNSQTLLQDSLTITSLSDSIIISLRKEYLILLPFVVQQAAILQSFLLIKGLPVRGGITSGKIFHKKNDSITFGKGLVKAAALEKVAKFPRVLVDSNLLKEYSEIYVLPIKRQETIAFFKNHYPTMEGFERFFRIAAGIMERAIISDELDNQFIVNFLENSAIKTYESQMKLNFIEQFNICLQVIKEKYKETKDKTELAVLEKWKYIESMIAVQLQVK